MPQIHLAKLADFKTDGDWSGTETDARLLRYLADASSIAERLAGVPDGGLRRAPGKVEYPGTTRDRSILLRLSVRAIESVSEVVQLYATGTDADFDTAVANGEALTLNADYAIGSSTLGILERINAHWYRHSPRLIRVTTTAGLADPARIKVALTTATWIEATKTLTQVGAFAPYAFTPGDKISIESGTGVTPGTYLVASRTGDDAIVLSESLSTAGVDLATGNITSAFNGMTDPPADLQAGIIRQAMMLRNTADTAGLEKIDLGDAGGAFTTRATKTHPALIDAVRRYRRLI